MKVAVVYNSGASEKDAKLQKTGRTLKDFLNGHEVIVHQRYGASFIPFADTVVQNTPGIRQADYKTALREAVLEILRKCPELIVTVGGDGLSSYVADTVIGNRSFRRRPAMLGIAAGTANVGPIVSFTDAQLGSFPLDRLDTMAVDAVEVLDGTCHVGYAFNDAIIGNSLLATIDGEVCNISVEQLVRSDEKVRIHPGVCIAAKNFSISVSGREEPAQEIGCPEDIRQIIVSPLQFDKLRGRAIFGGLCSGDDRGPVAAIGICDRVVVDSDPMARTWKGFTGIRHLVFAPDTLVTVSGLEKDAHIVIDGNPYVRRHDSLTFRCAPNIVRVCRKQEKWRDMP